MQALPGIDVDQVRRFGQSFCKLIKDARRSYGEMMMQETDDAPQDPNHEIVCISSGEDSDDGGGTEFLDLDLGYEVERSEYFRSEPAVEAFNAQCTFDRPASVSFSLSQCFTADPRRSHTD